MDQDTISLREYMDSKFNEMKIEIRDFKTDYARKDSVMDLRKDLERHSKNTKVELEKRVTLDRFRGSERIIYTALGALVAYTITQLLGAV